jgi:predicted O-methyltransferase YrrM
MVAERNADWLFADAYAVEDDAMHEARDASLQFGIESISPGVGAHLAVAAATHAAKSIIEIGTGAGLSGLWLLRGAPTAHLTTIDIDLDHHQVARTLFTAAGYPAKQVRLITGRAADVLPRMNEGSYDIVFVDADPESTASYTDIALGLVRVGGSVIVAHVLADGKVANPAKRDKQTVIYRELLKSIGQRDDVLAHVVPTGRGLLHLVRRQAHE